MRQAISLLLLFKINLIANSAAIGEINPSGMSEKIELRLSSVMASSFVLQKEAAALLYFANSINASTVPISLSGCSVV
jgi:hypothetical protein